MKIETYKRVSTEHQAEEGLSIEAQRELLIEFAKSKGLDSYKVYSDPDMAVKNALKER